MEFNYVEVFVIWDCCVKWRKLVIDKYFWNEQEGMYFDYDIVNCKQCLYESVMIFWVLWVGVVSFKQVVVMVIKVFFKFEVVGGLLFGIEESCGEIGLE